jgi:hypothetical protein
MNKTMSTTSPAAHKKMLRTCAAKSYNATTYCTCGASFGFDFSGGGGGGARFVAAEAAAADAIPLLAGV